MNFFVFNQRIISADIIKNNFKKSAKNARLLEKYYFCRFIELN